ncbi:hypothetical protein C5615_25740 [Burkholderia cepacia]|uniref:Uncharacterized protein n=1 Tax=Burkholderia cepacia TaxID=292 RepID=A0A2S8IIB7_BURCE|nr:hypothetical protein C5615_25740 [Burkholderia cepacia]
MKSDSNRYCFPNLLEAFFIVVVLNMVEYLMNSIIWSIGRSAGLQPMATAGTLVSSSATLDPGSRMLTTLNLSIRLANTQYGLTYTLVPLNGMLKTTGPASIQSIVVGHDATQPLVAVGYSAVLPNTQGIGGVVVLACH